MEQGEPKPSMLTFLALVHRRPGMYLGMDDERPDRRLDALGLTLECHTEGSEDVPADFRERQVEIHCRALGLPAAGASRRR